jgi:hypothetical protein
MTAKVTKKDMFNAILKVEGIVGNKEFEDFIKHEIELLDNKKKADRKPTKTQIENEVLKDKILDYLAEVDEPVTIKDMQNGIEGFKELSNQKINRLLIALRAKEVGKVKRTLIKKVAYFELGNEHEDAEVTEAEEV